MADFIPDIPAVLGVPPLLRQTPAPPIPTLQQTQIQDQKAGKDWGIFLKGKQVVTPDTCVSVDYRQGWALADYPVETGGFETYDKVDMPYDVRLRLASGGTPQNRQTLLKQINAIAETLEFYDVVTPEVIYHNCNVQHYDYRRTSTNGVGMITIEVWMLEIRVKPSRGANVTFPSASPRQADGRVAPQAPTSTQGGAATGVH